MAKAKPQEMAKMKITMKIIIERKIVKISKKIVNAKKISLLKINVCSGNAVWRLLENTGVMKKTQMKIIYQHRQ